jgi:hypothetical protein
MKCKYEKKERYKKLGFFERVAKLIDKIIGIKEEDYLTDEEARCVDKHFNKIRWKGP